MIQLWIVHWVWLWNINSSLHYFVYTLSKRMKNHIDNRAQVLRYNAKETVFPSRLRELPHKNVSQSCAALLLTYWNEKKNDEEITCKRQWNSFFEVKCEECNNSPSRFELKCDSVCFESLSMKWLSMNVRKHFNLITDKHRTDSKIFEHSIDQINERSNQIQIPWGADNDININYNHNIN